MRYQTKLIFIFLSFTLLGLLIINPIYYYQSRTIYLNQARDHLKSIVKTSANMIDFSGLDTLKKPSDEAGKIYARIQGDLQKIKRANDGKGLRIVYAYILKPVKDNPKALEFVVDADESINHMKLGTVSRAKKQEKLVLDHLNEAYVPSTVFHSQWGDLVTGYAPIRNDKGEYIATLGMDVYEARAAFVIKEVLHTLIYASIAALIAAFIAAWLLGKKLATPITRLAKNAFEAAHLKLPKGMHIEPHDQIKDIYRSIGGMERYVLAKKLVQKSFTQVLSSHFITRHEYRQEEEVCTLLYIDFSELSKFSQKVSDKVYHSLIHQFFESFIEVMSTSGGTLNKIGRDKAWVVFGLTSFPIERNQGAIECALEIERLVHEFNLHPSNASKDDILLGVGVLEGEVARDLYHNTECRVPYPIVEQAAHIADKSLELKVPLLVSKNVYRSVKEQFKMKKIEGDELLYEVSD